jgi:hypothetical protein
MSSLEALQPNASVRGILPDCLVIVVSAQWFGSEALELTCKNPTGRVANELLYRHDEARLEVIEQGRPWSFDGDGHLFRLVSEGAQGDAGGEAARPIASTARAMSGYDRFTMASRAPCRVCPGVWNHTGAPALASCLGGCWPQRVLPPSCPGASTNPVALG